MANTITKQGHDELQKELDYLINVKRGECADRIKVARDFGDLSENAEYDAAKDEQAAVEGRIIQIEAILSDVEIIDVSSAKNNVVVEGMIITLHDVTHDKDVTFKLAGLDAKYPQSISSSSPIGSAIKGKSKGQKVLVMTPNGATEYVIKSITKPQ